MCHLLGVDSALFNCCCVLCSKRIEKGRTYRTRDPSSHVLHSIFAYSSISSISEICPQIGPHEISVCLCFCFEQLPLALSRCLLHVPCIDLLLSIAHQYQCFYFCVAIVKTPLRARRLLCLSVFPVLFYALCARSL